MITDSLVISRELVDRGIKRSLLKVIFRLLTSVRNDNDRNLPLKGDDQVDGSRLDPRDVFRT